MNRSTLIRSLRPLLREREGLKEVLRRTDRAVSRAHHSLAHRLPSLIRPQPRQLTVAITAACNLRCQGCRYGRDFMVGERLPLDVTKLMLDDARDAGVNRVRLYGGEPCLHPDLPTMIEHSTSLGMDTYITTNGILLKDRIDDLHDAGLRWLTIGFYGIGDAYDAYTQRNGYFDKLERSLDAVRDRHGDAIEMQLNFVLIRPTCNLEALHRAFEFALKYDLYFHLDLYGYSMPFFTDGPDDQLQFRDADRPMVEEVGRELLRIKQDHGARLPQSTALIRSVPDWLLKGPDMRVPCDAYQLIWIGADGTVQLCDVCFKLGNLHESRLRDILFTQEHRQAARDGFQLKCPNCTCKSNTRILKDAASMRRYGP